MKKILIIEDESPLLEVMIEKFNLEGFETLGAKNGVDGLYLAHKQHPDLIILDIVMPKMDGMEMMQKLREDAWGKKVPVIILTNLNLEEMKILGKSKIPDQVEKDKPLHYFVKADMKLEDVVKTAKAAVA